MDSSYSGCQTAITKGFAFNVGYLNRLLLKHIIHFIYHRNVNPGVADAEVELQKNYRSLNINTLCVREESGAIRVMCFDKACPLLSFAKFYFVMTSRLISDLFRATWSATLNQARAKNPNLSIAHLHSEVWAPTFEQCQSLLEELYEQTITLGDVDRHFGKYRESGELKTQLQLLFHGVNECMHRKEGEKWIQRSVDKIVNYCQLCGYRDAANSFLELRDLLKLTKGDFRDVERISKKVMNTHCVVFRACCQEQEVPKKIMA